MIERSLCYHECLHQHRLIFRFYINLKSRQTHPCRSLFKHLSFWTDTITINVNRLACYWAKISFQMWWAWGDSVADRVHFSCSPHVSPCLCLFKCLFYSQGNIMDVLKAAENDLPHDPIYFKWMSVSNAALYCLILEFEELLEKYEGRRFCSNQGDQGHWPRIGWPRR